MPASTTRDYDSSNLEATIDNRHRIVIPAHLRRTNRMEDGIGNIARKAAPAPHRFGTAGRFPPVAYISPMLAATRFCALAADFLQQSCGLRPC